MNTPKKPISFAATEKELSQLNAIKMHYMRNSYADTIRYLINAENEKIFNSNNVITLNQQEQTNETMQP